MVERISGLRRFAYALGSTGFQISDRIVVGIGLYYYLPPGGRDLVPQVSQELFLGVLTIYGAAMLFGRVFDAVADPVVGHLCDRSRSRLGRRRSFLIWGVGPMMGIPVLLFFPPGAPGSPYNGIWLALLLGLYFIAFTIYAAPYLALLPELATDADDRARLSTLIAIVSFPAIILFGAGWGVGLEWGRSLGYSGEQALRGVVIAATGIGLLLCLAPILAVDERRFTRSVASDLSWSEALGATLGDRAFRIYLGAQLFFILSINLLGPSLVYYATVVLGRGEAFAGVLGGVMLIAVIVGFALVLRASRRLGPKRTVVICNLVFAGAVAGLWALVPDTPGGSHDAVRTGANRSAMYFGIQGLITKGMFGVSSALLAYLFARFGNSPEEPLGVLLIGPVAAVSCLVSTLLFLAYPEREVLALVRDSASSASPG